MSIPCKFERSILNYDEHGLILRSHHPEVYEAGLDDLKALRQRLRGMREKESTLARAKRREARASRGQSLPGTAEHPRQRKQVFAAAVKRVNREIHRIEKLEVRTAHVEAARRALALRRAAQFPPRPEAQGTAGEGMHPLPSRRRRTCVAPAKIGSVSQSVRNAQAARDARNKSVQ
jgi:hypothetical protein